MKAVKFYFPLLLSLLIFPFSVKSTTRYITTSDGTELFVTIKGQGTPCLYLHGGPGSGSHWLEKFMGEELEKHFTMIYLDQRGVSRSGSPADKNYSMDRMVLDFEEVRQALGFDQWLTMGHSFGGLLQMGYARRFPDAIKGMLMINTTLNMTESYEQGWCPMGSEFLGISHPLPCLEDSIPIMERWANLSGQVHQAGVFWKMGYAHEKNMEVMNASFGEIPDWNWEQGNLLMDVQDYWANFKPYTSSMHMPVLFFYGNTDWMVGPEHYKEVSFPNILLWESNVGHMPFMENQQDLVRAIETFRKNYGF